TRPSRSVYGTPPTSRGPLKFASLTSTPLIALRYMPSTVRTKPAGSSRSNPAEMPRYWGYLKFGSVMLTPSVPACPGPGAGWPAHDVGNVLTFTVNAGTVAGVVHASRTRPSPVFAYAFPSRM